MRFDCAGATMRRLAALVAAGLLALSACGDRVGANPSLADTCEELADAITEQRARYIDGYNHDSSVVVNSLEDLIRVTGQIEDDPEFDFAYTVEIANALFFQGFAGQEPDHMKPDGSTVFSGVERAEELGCSIEEIERLTCESWETRLAEIDAAGPAAEFLINGVRANC